MKIFQSPKKTPITNLSNSFFKKLPLLVAIISTSILFCYWAKQQFYKNMKRYGHFRVFTTQSEKVNTLLHGARTVLREYFSPYEIESLDIQIKHKHLDKIHKKREQAFKDKLLKSSDADFVPVQIKHRHKLVNAKIRLKGDMLDHLKSNKWSFRIKTKGDEHFMGMRVFSIQSPRTRNFQHEALYLDSIRNEGVLAPRYFFVDVSINGDRIGVMAVEEHFSKELLEYNNRRESVILKFDENLFFSAFPHSLRLYTWRNAKISHFRPKKTQKSKSLRRDNALAATLLHSFREEKLDASDVFDIETMSTFLALTELWGTQHSAVWRNIRFYYNPILGRLEPIAFDGSRNLFPKHIQTVIRQELIQEILNDKKMMSAFLERAKHFATYYSSIDGIDWLDKKEKEEYLPALQKDYPLLKKSAYSLLKNRSKQVLSLIEQYEKRISIKRYDKFPSVLNATLFVQKKEQWIEFSNKVYSPVIIESISVSPPERETQRSLASISPISIPIKIPATRRGHPAKKKTIKLRQPYTKNQKIIVKARVQGSKRLRRIPVEDAPFNPISVTHVPNGNIKQTLNVHGKYLYKVPGKKRLRFRVGRWVVKDNIIIPSGFDLEVPAGTKIQFHPQKGLISNGPINFLGSKSAPIVITGSPTWGGILVKRAAIQSKIFHTRIENTTGVRSSEWALDAGISFYESPVHIENLEILNNNSEDAINIVRSKFSMKNLTVLKTKSDAVDIDFSEGQLSKANFENIGGDAIDLNASKANIRNVRIEKVRDKAISVGENSRLVADSVRVNVAGTGVASKDRSHVSIKNSHFTKINFASLVAFMKKPEHGPASIDAKNITVQATKNVAIAQHRSKIHLDGQLVETKSLDVFNLYRDGVMKK